MGRYGQCRILVVRRRTRGTIVIPQWSKFIFNPILDERYIMLLLLLVLQLRCVTTTVTTTASTGIETGIDHGQCRGIIDIRCG